MVCGDICGNTLLGGEGCEGCCIGAIGTIVQLVDDYDCVLYHTKPGAQAAVKFGEAKNCF